LAYKTVKKPPQPFKHFFLAMQISGTLQCPVIGIGVGVWLDGHFGTTPWLMFTLLLGTLIFSAYSIYRAIQYDQKSHRSKG